MLGAKLSVLESSSSDHEQLFHVEWFLKVIGSAELHRFDSTLDRGVGRHHHDGGTLGACGCLLLVMCTHPLAKKALTLHLARSEGHERYCGCNLMYRKVLASSHQHLMAEATTQR